MLHQPGSQLLGRSAGRKSSYQHSVDFPKKASEHLLATSRSSSSALPSHHFRKSMWLFVVGPFGANSTGIA
jgi:hypothetical protein